MKGGFSQIQSHTVNGERFTGLNVCVFHGFQEHCESFPVNIYLRIIYKLRIMALLKCCKRMAPRKFKFPVKNFIECNLRKFSPANLSPFTVYVLVTTIITILLINNKITYHSQCT